MPIVTATNINRSTNAGFEKGQPFVEQVAIEQDFDQIPDYIANHSTGNTIHLSSQSNFNQLGMVNKQLSANAHDKNSKPSSFAQQ